MGGLLTDDETRAVCEACHWAQPRLGARAAMDVAMEALRARHRSLDRSTAINTAMIVVERAGMLIDANADAVLRRAGCIGR
jgi:hypothetical protein